MCLSGTFLNQMHPFRKEIISINENKFSLLRADYQKNIKKGGVFIYFKDCLPQVKRIKPTNMNKLFLATFKERFFNFCPYVVMPKSL